MHKQISGKQVVPKQNFSIPALTEVQINVLNTGLKLYKGDVDAFCQTICQLYAQNRRGYLTKDQTGKDGVQVFNMDRLRKRYNKIGIGDRNIYGRSECQSHSD
jgi:hypothetical protein